MLSNDRFALLGILDSIQRIELYIRDISGVESLKGNLLVFDACLMNIVNIGEMVSKLSDEFTEEHNLIEWYKIKALRNIIAHDYFGVDYDEIWSILKIHIPHLKNYITPLI